MINAGGKRWLHWNIQWNENKASSSEEQNEKWLAGKQLAFVTVTHLWAFQRLLSLCFSQLSFFPNSYTANNNLKKQTNLPNGQRHARGVQYPAQKWKGGADFILPSPPFVRDWKVFKLGFLACQCQKPVHLCSSQLRVQLLLSEVVLCHILKLIFETCNN